MNQFEAARDSVENNWGERMSDEALGNLVAFVGNHESKALAMSYIAYQPYMILDREIVAQGIADMQRLPLKYEGDEGWVPSASAIENYCTFAFEPAGLIREEHTGRAKMGFAVTKKGETDGWAVAGNLLDFSQRHDIPLKKIFSGTSSQSKAEVINDADGEFLFKSRAPINRIKLFRALLSQDKAVRAKDLEELTGVDDSLLIRHIADLKELGLVQYETPIKEGAKTEFILEHPTDQVPEHEKYKKLTRDTYHVLLEDPKKEWSIDQVVQALIVEEPRRNEQKDLRKSVGKVIHLLKENDIVGTPNYTPDRSTQVWLNAEQREFFTDLVGILDRIQQRDIVAYAEGAAHALRFMFTPQLAREAMLRARRASNKVDRPSSDEITRTIQTCVSAFPDCTTNQVREYLREYGNELALPTVSRYLKQMREKGVLESQGKAGTIMHWRSSGQRAS